MATITSASSGAWATGGTWVGGTKPANDDAVVIAAGHSILMDDDQSGFANGIQTLTITSHATDPGMLYFANSTSGYLKMKTGYNIVGTNAAARGRILANSDGVWGNTGALAYAYKAVIELPGTSSLAATYLDLRLYHSEPTIKYARTYGTKYEFDASTAVNPTTDVIDLGTTPPSAGTVVLVVPIGAGVLPTGIVEDCLFYVRSVSGNTFKFSASSSSDIFVDITAVGSGTCAVLTGHTSTATGAMNVLDDVTGDAQWVTTAGHNRCGLVNIARGDDNRDFQRSTISTITSTVITLGNNVDSVQSPGARIYLASRNVSIRSDHTTSKNMIDFTTATHTGHVIGAELANTVVGTTNYHIGIQKGIGVTFTGVGFGVSTLNQAAGNTTVSNFVHNGIALGCNNTLYYTSNVTGSGSFVGCTVVSYRCKTLTLSGDIIGCTNIGSDSANVNISGNCLGLSYVGLSQSIISGTIKNGYYLINSGYNNVLTGNTYCCTYTVSGGYNNYIYGDILFSVNGAFTGCSKTFMFGDIIKCAIAFRNVDVTMIGGQLINCVTEATYEITNSGYFSNTRSLAFKYAGTANDTRMWSYSGNMTHETTEVPTGKTYSHKFTYESSIHWTRMEWELNRTDALGLSFAVYAKHSASSLSADERLHFQIIDPTNDPLLIPTGTPLAEWIASDTTDWQSSTLTYTRSDDQPLFLRIASKRGSGTAYAYFDPPAAGTGSGGGNIFSSVAR